LIELGCGERLLEERLEKGGDAGGVHREPGEILAGTIAEVWFLSSVSHADEEGCFYGASSAVRGQAPPKPTL
jgi:hypothetical protein